MFLTAADEETDVIMGLDIGGDDYITKPFKLAVFLSRVNALLHRSGNFSQKSPELYSNGIRVELVKESVYKKGKPVELTASEYKLLCLFMENPDIVLLPEQEPERIETLVQNLLKISKFDAGAIVMEKAPENIFEMMTRIKKHFSFRAGGREGTHSFGR